MRGCKLCTREKLMESALTCRAPSSLDQCEELAKLEPVLSLRLDAEEEVPAERTEDEAWPSAATWRSNTESTSLATLTT
jgi:hypothetical protein